MTWLSRYFRMDEGGQVNPLELARNAVARDPNYNYLNVLPAAQDQSGGWHPAVPGVLHDFASDLVGTIEGPGRALHGEPQVVDPTQQALMLTGLGIGGSQIIKKLGSGASKAAPAAAEEAAPEASGPHWHYDPKEVFNYYRAVHGEEPPPEAVENAHMYAAHDLIGKDGDWQGIRVVYEPGNKWAGTPGFWEALRYIKDSKGQWMPAWGVPVDKLNAYNWEGRDYFGRSPKFKTMEEAKDFAEGWHHVLQEKE
jgi:hypothetical protein